MANQTIEQNQLRDRLLGRTFRLDQVMPGMEIGRDLVLADGPGGRDFKWVLGMDALGQDLTVALTTALGSDVFNTTFGFDGINAIAEETNPVLMRERIRVSIIRVLEREPRVRRILDVKLNDGRLDPVSAGESRTMDVVVSFEAISGESFIVNLGKVTP